MKKVIVFLIMCFVGYSQTNEGAFGIRFGMPLLEAEKIITSKGGIGIGNEDNKYFYDKLVFAGEPVSLIILVNQKNQVIKLFFMSEPNYQTAIFTYFYKIKNGLVLKYGEAPIDIEEYYPPYNYGDGYTYYAFKTQKAMKYIFYNELPVKIFVQITASSNIEEFKLTIAYEDSELMTEHNNYLAQKDSKDF